MLSEVYYNAFKHFYLISNWKGFHIRKAFGSQGFVEIFKQIFKTIFEKVGLNIFVLKYLLISAVLLVDHNLLYADI